MRFRGHSIADADRAADRRPRTASSTSSKLAGPRGGDRARHPRRARHRGSPSSSRWAWATWRSTAPRRRSPAARRSASGSRRSSAPTCAASATSSTSPPSACTRATTGSCSTRWRKLERQGQHAGGGGARRGHHPPRGARDRPGPRRGTARRARGRRGHGRGADAQSRVDHRPLPRASRSSIPLQPRRAGRTRKTPAIEVAGAEPAQPEGRRRAHPARAAHAW